MPLFGKKKETVSDSELVKEAENTNNLLRDFFQAYIELDPQIVQRSGEKTITAKNLPDIVREFRGTLVGIAQRRPRLLQDEKYRSILFKSPYSSGTVSNQFWLIAIEDALKPPKN